MSRLLRSITLTQITLVGIFALIASRATMDADTFWHMAIGRWIVWYGQILAGDVFSFTRFGWPWNLPGWPAQIGLHLLYQIGGPGALNLAVAAIFTASFWLISKIMPGRDEVRALALLLGALTASVHAIARPAILTFVFVALSLYLLERYRMDGKDYVWLLIPLTVLWANVHPMFYLGSLLIGVYLVEITVNNSTRMGTIIRPGMSIFANVSNILGSADRRLVLYLLASIAAMLLNPRGLAGLLYPITAMQAQGGAIAFIYEWQSPDFHDWLTLPFIGLFFLTIASMAFSRRRMTLLDFSLLVGFGFAALYSRRYISLFGLASPLLIARYALEIPWPELTTTPKQSRKIILALVGFLFCGATGIAGYQVVDALKPETNFQRMEESGVIPPKVAVEKLRQTQGNLFNSYNYGGYLIWAYPGRQVFVDSRAVDLYGDEMLVDNWYKAVMLEPGWQEVLERWNIQTVFIETTWPLAEALKLAGWKLVYQDEKAVIYERK